MINKRNIAILLAVLLLLAGLTALSQPMPVRPVDTVTIPREEYERLKQFELLDEAKHYLEQEYYKVPDQQAMLDGAIQGLMSGTDDVYTFYYPAESWKTLWEEDAGRYAGIGVQMQGNLENSLVTITRVFRGTPAEAAGLRRGDVFFKVEEIAVDITTMQDAVNVMRGLPGEQVHVEVLRDGQVLPFDIIKADITINRVESKMLDDRVGYIAMYEYAGGSFADFKAAFDQLSKEGMQSLVFDLRDNGGGWVEMGARIADIFLDKVLFFYSEGRDGLREQTYLTDGRSDMPLVLLVNENSASTTEILAAAMKDYGRARLVGVTTFGKGLIQRMQQLSDGVSGIQFTIAQYFSPKGNPVHMQGVTPDVEAVMPDELKSHLFQIGDLNDPQLKAAWEEALRLQPDAKQAAGL